MSGVDNIEDLKNIEVIDEPQFDIMCKWLGFAVTFVVMLLVLIYASSYFARGSGRYIDRRHERGVSVMDRRAKNKYQSDHRSKYAFKHDIYDEEYDE